MEYTLCIQDPRDPDTEYLYEAIVAQVSSGTLEAWRGIFAFATGRAVKNLFVEDPAVERFARSSRVELIVGLDAVTDVSALEELSRLDGAYENFQARVFMNPSAGLFHPKISHFRHNNGRSVLIVGSGNLTSGGLKGNIEAYSVVTGTHEELETLSVWDSFLARHAEAIRAIDGEALERARQNRVSARRRPPRAAEAEEEILEVEAEAPAEPVSWFTDDSRVLVAQVPGAGRRWHQVHFNADIIREFYRARPDSSHRVSLSQVLPNGDVMPEENRPIVFSHANRNYKIEIGGRREMAYPEGPNPPILIVGELWVRAFRYILLMPGEDGYSEMSGILAAHESIGRGLRRVIVPYREIKTAWADTPL